MTKRTTRNKSGSKEEEKHLENYQGILADTWGVIQMDTSNPKIGASKNGKPHTQDKGDERDKQ